MSVDLERLERLHAAATPGPWEDKGIGSIYSPAHRKTIAECMPPLCRGLKNIQQHGINAAYIVAACNSLPALIAELKEARAEKAAFKSWQTGTPPGPGFYWVKYKSGYVKVIELALRRAGFRGGVSWTYLGLANEYYQPFENEEDIVAWAGPLPMPEKKEAGEDAAILG